MKKSYEERVEELEAEGLTTSDAQGVADLEFRTVDQANELSCLISAAPDLLEALLALEKAVHAGIGADPELYRRAHLLAEAAIKKARGE